MSSITPGHVITTTELGTNDSSFSSLSTSSDDGIAVLSTHASTNSQQLPSTKLDKQYQAALTNREDVARMQDCSSVLQILENGEGTPNPVRRRMASVRECIDLSNERVLSFLSSPTTFSPLMTQPHTPSREPRPKKVHGCSLVPIVSRRATQDLLITWRTLELNTMDYV